MKESEIMGNKETRKLKAKHEAENRRTVATGEAIKQKAQGEVRKLAAKLGGLRPLRGIIDKLLTEEAPAQAPTIAADGPADWPDFDKLGGKPMLVPLFINEEGNVGPLDGFCRGFGAISGTEEASETTLGVYTAEGVYYNILIDGRVKCHVPTFFIDKQPYYYPIVASMTIAQGMPVVDPATGNLRSREEVQKIMAEAPAQSERQTPADVFRPKDPAKLAEWLAGDDLNLEDCPDQEALARLAVRVRRMFYQETMKTQVDEGQKGS